MIRFRPFRNTDPPALADIWCGQPPLRRLVQPVTVDLLERHVFAKPYFEREGLIVAVDTDQPVGFVHAGFARTADGTALDHAVGVTCLLMVARQYSFDELAPQLLEQSERYLAGRGAQICYGGAAAPADPFYLGLYGGSQQAGILDSDRRTLELFRTAGYEEHALRHILERRLVGFRPPVDRQLMHIRRSYQIDSRLDPPTRTWWQACTQGTTDRTRFVMSPRRGGPPQGSVTFWDLDPLAGNWGVHAAGLEELELDTAADEADRGLFLLGEALRQFQLQGVTLVEAQTDTSHPLLTRVLERLDFEEVETGHVLLKQLG